MSFSLAQSQTATIGSEPISTNKALAEQESLHAFAVRYLENYCHWLSAPWTADDRGYASIRYQIDLQIAKGDDPSSIFEDWKKPYDKNKTNPQLDFGCAYAAYKLIDAADVKPVSKTLSPDQVMLQSAQNVYYDYGYHYTLKPDQINIPQTYNTMRLIFFNVYPGLPNRACITLGDRLLAKDSSDETVQYYLIRALCSKSESKDFAHGLKMAKAFEGANPNNPRSWQLKVLFARHEAFQQHSLASFDESISDERKIASLFSDGSIGNQNAEVMADQWQRQRDAYAKAGWQ